MATTTAVPVTMGSPRFRTCGVRDCLVHRVWLPGSTMLPTHFHDRPTFAVILDGGLEVRFADPGIRRPTLMCRPGSILTQPVGERHSNRVTASGARLVVLQPDLAGGLLPPGCARLLGRINHFRDAHIEAEARRLNRELMAPDDATPLTLEGLALGMLAEAGRLDAMRDLRPGETPPWLRRAVEFVHENFRAKLRISDIAAAAEVEAARLTVRFRREHRMPLGSYVRRLRLEWAADQLATTTRPIAWIAFEAGYADQAHLTRALGRVTGTTPAAFRRSRQR